MAFDLALIAALAAVAPVAEPAPYPPPTVVSLSPAQMFAMAERMQSAGRVEDATRTLRALLEDRDPRIRNEARFRLAMIDRDRGELSGAAVQLRRLLDDRPDAQRARLELAAILGRLGDENAARRELRAVRAGTLPADIARIVDRWSEALRASKPWGLSFEVALAPDSNINRATRSDTLDTVIGDFDIDEAGTVKSGTGVAVRALGYRRFPIGEDVNLLAQLSASTDLYRDNEFNFMALEAAVGPEFTIGRTRVSVEAAAGQSWFGGKPFTRQLRLSATGRRPVGPRTAVTAKASLTSVDNRFNALQDGRGTSLSLSAEHALSSVNGIIATATGERLKARDPGYSTRSWRLGLQGWQDLGSSTLFAGAEIGRLEADDRLLLLPEARRDRYTRFSAGALLRSLTFEGMAPFIRLSRERNRSNIAFYDYKRTRTEIGFSRAF